jgi:hypothetical protein
VVPGSDVFLGQSNIPALEATGLHTSKALLCLPTVLSDGFDVYGSYTIGMIVDAPSTVEEDFEHNNMNRGMGIDLAIFTLGADDTSGPMVVDYMPRVTSATFDHLDITFIEPIQWSSFSRADITFQDPQGHEIVVSDPELVEGTKFRIHFATQTAYGDYPLLIGPWIEDTNGNPMNQNQNETNGEGTLDRFETTVVLYDRKPPYVEMMTVENEGVGSVGYIDLTFSEDIDPTTFTTGDIVILGYDSETPDQYYASQIEALNSTQFRIYTRYQDGSFERPLDHIQAYDIQVGPNVYDLNGNRMDQRANGGSTQRYSNEFPVCSGFAAALSSLNAETTAMILLRMAVADAIQEAFPDAPTPDALNVKESMGGVPLTQTDLLSDIERTEFFRIAAGGAITGALGFSAEAAGVTPSVGAHLKRDLAKIELGLVIEAIHHAADVTTYKVALALTADSGLPVDLSLQAETLLEFPEDLSEFTLGYTFSLDAGMSILAELESEIELDFELIDIEAGFMLFAEAGAGLGTPVTLCATLSPEQFVTAMGAQDVASALEEYITYCAFAAWPGTPRDEHIFGRITEAMAMADYWNLSVALDATLEGAMGSKAGLGLGFETPFEIGELGLEARLSVSAGVCAKANLYQWALSIPIHSFFNTDEIFFNGDFEHGLMTWNSPSGRAQTVSDGLTGMMASLGTNLSELSRPIILPVNASHLTFNYGFSPNTHHSSLYLQLNEQTLWQASGEPASPNEPVLVDISAFSGQTYELRFLFWNPEDANAWVVIDDVNVHRSAVFDFTDSFNSGVLNDSYWNWITPASGPTYSLTLLPGHLQLITPNTQAFDCWGQTDQMPRLTYEGMIGNWSIETQVSVPASLSGQGFDTGLFVRLNENDYLTHGYTWGGPYLSSARTGTGQFLPAFPANTHTVELRITKSDDDYGFFYRHVGDVEWIQSYELMGISEAPQSVGLFTKTWQAINTQADFDYFQIVSYP